MKQRARVNTSQEQSSSTPRPSAALALAAIAIALLNLWAWIQSSNVAYLISAAAFAALAPGFYFSPISLRKSFKASAEAIRKLERPPWGVTVGGLALLLAGLAVRWFA